MFRDIVAGWKQGDTEVVLPPLTGDDICDHFRSKDQHIIRQAEGNEDLQKPSMALQR